MVLIQLEVFNVGIGVFKRYNAVYALQFGMLFHVYAAQHVHFAVGKHGGLGECFGIGHYNSDVVQINGTLVLEKGQVGFVIRVGLKDYAVAGNVFVHVERAVGDSAPLQLIIGHGVQAVLLDYAHEAGAQEVHQVGTIGGKVQYNILAVGLH